MRLRVEVRVLSGESRGAVVGESGSDCATSSWRPGVEFAFSLGVMDNHGGVEAEE